MAIIDPEGERKRLAGLYSGKLDGELERVASEAHELTPLAQEVLSEELSKRGLTSEIGESSARGGDTEQPQSLNAVVDGEGPPVPEFQEPVFVGRFRDLPEALIASGSLTSAGIKNTLVDDNTIRMDWFWSNLLGGVKLLVEAKDAEGAMEILAQPIPESLEVEETERYQQPRCPKCGSLDVSFEELHKVAFASLIFNLPLPIHRKGWICQSCKHSWEGREDQLND